MEFALEYRVAKRQTTTLAELVNQANSWLVPTAGDSLPLDFVCNCLVAIPHRSHANTPLAPVAHPASGRLTQRAEPLSPDTLVCGDYLLLRDQPHDGYCLLSAHDSREDLKAEILGGAGAFNVWVGIPIAFEHDKVLPYSISYRDRQGVWKLFELGGESPDNPQEIELLWRP